MERHHYALQACVAKHEEEMKSLRDEMRRFLGKEGGHDSDGAGGAGAGASAGTGDRAGGGAGAGGRAGDGKAWRTRVAVSQLSLHPLTHQGLVRPCMRWLMEIGDHDHWPPYPLDEPWPTVKDATGASRRLVRFDLSAPYHSKHNRAAREQVLQYLHVQRGRWKCPQVFHAEDLEMTQGDFEVAIHRFFDSRRSYQPKLGDEGSDDEHYIVFIASTEGDEQFPETTATVRKITHIGYLKRCDKVSDDVVIKLTLFSARPKSSSAALLILCTQPISTRSSTWPSTNSILSTRSSAFSPSRHGSVPRQPTT